MKIKGLDQDFATAALLAPDVVNWSKEVPMVEQDTNRFEVGSDKRLAAHQIMAEMRALEEKGYDPINQLVGYFPRSHLHYQSSWRARCHPSDGARRTAEVVIRDYIERL